MMQEMVRVYKTDIDNRTKAKNIVHEIRQVQPGSDPSIDLEDCDKVLRIENSESKIDESKIKRIVSNYGYWMEPMV